MKPEPPPLRIGTPCPKQWDQMTGDAKRRFCEHCQLHVHNLSAMSERERERFVARSGGRACIAYQLRRDGTLITPSFWRTALTPFRWMRFAVTACLATFLPFLFSACSEPKKSPPLLGKMVCPNPTPHKDTTVGKRGPMILGTPKAPPPTGGAGSSR